MASASSVVDGAMSDVPDNDSYAVVDRSSEGCVTFPRSARLLDGKSYDAVFGSNRRVADRYWTVLVRQAPGIGGARIGLAIAKKRAKRAVDRNRIKRVARESFRHCRHRLVGCEVVVMNRDAAASASTRTLRQSLDALWTRILRQSAGSSADGKAGR